MLKDDTDTPQQKLDLYSILFLALPDDDLSVIENVSEADKSCGFHAWTILVDRSEDGGIYEYHSITDTWDVQSLNIDAVKRCIRPESMRTESHAQSHVEAPSPAAVSASPAEVAAASLKLPVSELKYHLKF
jgi:hypothetical protein